MRSCSPPAPRPRMLPGWSGPGVHALRTLADAAALRDELLPGTRVAIVGAGFVGTEVASTALSLGASVTLVDLAQAPLERVLGAEVGSLLAARYAEAGIELRLGAPVERSELDADVVVVAVGVVPETVAAAGANGIPTDACGRTAIPGIFAAGDVAEAWHPLLGQAVARRALDERRRPGCRGRVRNPRRGAPACGAAVLLVGPVRASASVRRSRRVVGGRGARGRARLVRRALPGRARRERRCASRQPAGRGRAAAERAGRAARPAIAA